jgi:hypothetical protein
MRDKDEPLRFAQREAITGNEMWETLVRKLLAQLQRAEFSAVDCPSQAAIYFITTACITIAFCYCVYEKRSKQAFWCVVGLILINLTFSKGEDTVHHVNRIVVLSEQIRRYDLSLLFTDPATGDVYPVFVYYSFLPYILPVALTLAGVSAFVAYKLALGIQLIVFAAGLHALIERPRAAGDTHNARPDFFLTILFLSATYVHGLWLERSAFGELWAVSLAPWAVRFALSPQTTRPLVAVLFLQICAHPLVFTQSIVGELVVAFGLSWQPPAMMLRRGLMAVLIALGLSMPFWLPQFSLLHDIVGQAALPVSFSDTFLTVRQLYHLWDPNIGVWLPCGIVVMIAASRGRLPWRVWVMICACIALAALQTVYLRDIAVRIPILNQSQFVWRLMLPTAFIAFGALLLGW